MAYGDILTAEEERRIELIANILYTFNPMIVVDEDTGEQVVVKWEDIRDSYPATHEAHLENACGIAYIIVHGTEGIDEFKPA